jgi:hypothetical protein
MKMKYEINNDYYSQESYVGTYEEIIDFVISCNYAWGTEYSEEDFRVSGTRIMVKDDSPFGESVLAVEVED